MPKQLLNFAYVEKHIHKKTFGILGTLTEKNRPHSTGIIYCVSKESTPFRLYCLTSRKYKKTRNIENNPNVSFVIPFPHYYFRFAPSSCIQFQGVAKIIPFKDGEVMIELFKQKRILRKLIKDINQNEIEDYVFLEIKPDIKIFCHGIGFSLIEMKKNHVGAFYSVIIPKDRQ
ncbi:MAG: pyridoxamine 5'-phosphate oxidase family protein [Candidatus Hodarchaeales archaeon]|jgi:hypothetical protein